MVFFLYNEIIGLATRCEANCLYQMHGGVGEVGNDLNCLLLGHELDLA